MSEHRTSDDAASFAAWHHGDRAAGAALFERHYPAVARFFHNKVNEEAKDDLVHETFLACLEHAPRFRGASSFRTFLFAIAHRVLADHLRRQYRSAAPRARRLELEELSIASLGPGPAAPLIARQEQRLLLEALRRIPLLHQTALELHYWESLTAAQIGEVLGIPLGTAKTRLRDGRGYLIEQLRELASSPAQLQSTLDTLARWADRARAAVPAPHERAPVRQPGA